MTPSTFYPYRSEAARDFCFAYLDTLAAKWPVESQERVVPTRYGPTFVRISGPTGAPPLVLLHGAGTTSLMWAPNVQALSAEYRTIAVDQIGEFGRSICTRPVQCFSDLFAWLNDLFDALELGNGVSLAGLSYGGALAAQYALRFPERLHKIVLLAPAATALRLGTAFAMRLILAAVSVRRFLPPLIRWTFKDMARKDPQWVDATIEMLRLNIRSRERHRPPIPGVLTDAQWGSLRVPALFLVGENEVIYSADKAVRRLNRVAPQVTAEIVAGAGHDLTFVQAAMVNQKICEFLRLENPAEADKPLTHRSHVAL